jgi:hypothetical protein
MYRKMSQNDTWGGGSKIIFKKLHIVSMEPKLLKNTFIFT